MSYIPSPNLPPEVAEEFRRVSQLWSAPVRFIVLAPTYAEPVKKPDGLVAYADGTTWNPGSGAGTYQWRGGAWQPWEGAGGGGGGLTAEQVMDTVAAMLTAGTNITLTYNDAGDTLTIDAAGSSDITAAAAMGV